MSIAKRLIEEAMTKCQTCEKVEGKEQVCAECADSFRVCEACKKEGHNLCPRCTCL